MAEIKFLEGSRAIAEVVTLCKPQVIAAYPITPQTHIVAELSQIIADGDLETQYILVESEHSAASVCQGAAAKGARTYTSTTSQGMLLMTEVIFAIAGMRLPVVMTCANRAISAPISIWNDQQDSFSMRDSGWIQLYAESNQEAVDLQLITFKLAEEVLLPGMMCMDGFVLTHASEPISMPSQEEVDDFLPSYQPKYHLDPDNPVSMGMLATPDGGYMEARYMIHKTLRDACPDLEKIMKDYSKSFGRTLQLVEKYRTDDAEIILVTAGSITGTVKEAVDQLRNEGKKTGVVKIIAFRPFPEEQIVDALKESQHVIVLDRAISLGRGGPLATEIQAAFYGKDSPSLSSCFAGIGGKDVSIEMIKNLVGKASRETLHEVFLGLQTSGKFEWTRNSP